MDKHPGDHNLYLTRRRPSGPGGSSPFGGLGRELYRLSSALKSAADGQGGAVFLTGHLGIGKTRIAREALALARSRGFTVLEGRAYPLEAGLAYAPFLAAFSPLLRGLHPSSLKTLVDGLPDLGRLFVDLHLPAPPFQDRLGDPALEKTRLFEGVSRLVERLALKAPLALFVDDVHCADPASLELLHYLARGLPDRRVLLLATYNDEEWDSCPALRSLVESLEREGLSEEIIVTGLEPEAVEEMVRGILGGAVAMDLVSFVNARAGGTPLFVEALIADLKDSGRLANQNGVWQLDGERAIAVPRSIKRLILERLSRLVPAERRVLNLIAVMGDAVSHTILGAASGLEEETLFESLRHLRAAGLVAERIDGSDVVHCITHPLIQEVAYTELPETERRRAHMAAIQAFERLRPNDIVRLARHYRGVGPEAESGRALSVLLEAAARSLAVYANEEAAMYYIAALTIVREGRHPAGAIGPDGPILPWLLERLGEVWERSGSGGLAIAFWSQALAERQRGSVSSDWATAIGRLRGRLALAESDQGHFDLASDQGHFDLASEHLAAGFAVLADQEPCQELADLCFARYQVFNLVGNAAGVAEAARELLSVAEQLGSPRAEAEANLAASMACLLLADFTNARQRALQALTVAERAQELALCCRVHFVLTIVGMRLGDLPLMRDHAERGMAVSKGLRAPILEVAFRFCLAHVNNVAGAWDESLRDSMEAIVLARRLGILRYLAFALAERAVILALRGDVSEAQACIQEVRMAFGSGTPDDRPVFSPINMAEMALALELGQVERALVIANRFVKLSAGAAPAGLTAAFMPMSLMLLAQAQVAAGDPTSALETARKIILLGPVGSPYLMALSSRAEGLGFQALGQEKAAMACLSRARETFAGLEMPFEVARVSLEQATFERSRQPEAAAAAARQSLAIFQPLGAQSYVNRSRRLLRELGIVPPAPRRIRIGGPLSQREIEVARLVAEGLTTMEIAEHLTLSRHTIDTHLGRMYSRLGIRSRAELTRYMIESGLLLPHENRQFV